MRLRSPRSTALNQTLEKSPNLTSPNTIAPLAMNTDWPSFGRVANDRFSRFSSSLIFVKNPPVAHQRVHSAPPHFLIYTLQTIPTPGFEFYSIRGDNG